ncbi:MAG TPA: hypothetical protein VKA73_02185 [Rubrobacter sp.]|nr:hypothetical protein [Rubrobacter sp.]
MIERLRTSWRIFAAGRPGLRFRERYRLRRGRRRGGFDLVGLSYIVVGAMLMVLSALFGWLPVLGWGTAVLGLGMIAGEYYPAARLMDWLEVRARRLFGPLGKSFVRLPAWAQLSTSLAIALATFVLVYGLFSLALAG